MSRRRLVPLVLVLVVIAAVALVLGGWSVRGRTVTVTHGAMTITVIDAGAPGASAGDVRLFEVPAAVKGSSTPGRMDATMTTTGVNVPDQGS
jgi:hypothetical protein